MFGILVIAEAAFMAPQLFCKPFQRGVERGLRFKCFRVAVHLDISTNMHRYVRADLLATAFERKYDGSLDRLVKVFGDDVRKLFLRMTA